MATACISQALAWTGVILRTKFIGMRTRGESVSNSVIARPKSSATSILLVALMTTVALSVVHVPLALGASSVTDQIHLSWTGNPATSITVMWHTPSSTNAASVQYGTTTAYGFTVTGTTFPSSGSGYLHQALLFGLTPQTTYHYRVVADDGSWSSDRSFSTAPSGGGDFNFVTLGDMGRTNNSIVISNLAAGEDAAFTVGAGDYWYSGGAETATDQWFNINQQLMSTAAFMPSRGNHESLNDFLVRFSLPPPETYYSFQYGATHFLVIDTNQNFTTGSPQRSFIESDLQQAASNPSVKWVFAIFHHPPFASSSSFQSLTARQELSPLFDRYGVDMVFSGHAHFYERTFPVKSDGTRVSTDPFLYVNPGAPIYLVTGGGGADPRSMCSATKQVWSVTCITVYEFLQIHVSSNFIQLAAVGIDGKAFDGFTLTKGSTADTTSPSQPKALAAASSTAAQVDLSWQPSTDDVALVGYDLYRDGVKLASAGWWATSYSDTSVSPSTTHTYAVVAFDSARNYSVASDRVTVTTPPGFVLLPTDDATVRSDLPSNNYRASSTLQADYSPVKNFLLKFSISGVGSKTVISAQLRLFVVDPSPVGGTFYQVSNSWTESTVNWNNAPPIGSSNPVAQLRVVSTGFWCGVDVTPIINGDETVSLRIDSSSSDAVYFSSKEGSHPPQLVVTISN